jgi:hypothetical protein
MRFQFLRDGNILRRISLPIKSIIKKTSLLCIYGSKL